MIVGKYNIIPQVRYSYVLVLSQICGRIVQ